MGEGEAGVAGEEGKAKGGGAGCGVVGEAEGIFKGAKWRVFVKGSEFVGLQLP